MNQAQKHFQLSPYSSSYLQLYSNVPRRAGLPSEIPTACNMGEKAACFGGKQREMHWDELSGFPRMLNHTTICYNKDCFCWIYLSFKINLQHFCHSRVYHLPTEYWHFSCITGSLTAYTHTYIYSIRAQTVHSALVIFPVIAWLFLALMWSSSIFQFCFSHPALTEYFKLRSPAAFSSRDLSHF